MSKNRNRAKLNKAKSLREYHVLLKTTPKDNRWFCNICSRRVGKFQISCGPKYVGVKRKYRTWKHNRKTQWK